MTFFFFTFSDTSPNSILVHALNTLYVSANLLICAKPMRVLHLVHPFTYGLVYVIFSPVYQKTTGNVVYVQLNWDNMPQTVLFMLGILFLILPFCILSVWRSRGFEHWSTKNSVRRRLSFILLNLKRVIPKMTTAQLLKENPLITIIVDDNK